MRLEASELQINNISKEYRAQLHNKEVIILQFDFEYCLNTVKPRFNEVAGDRPSLFVKSRVRFFENLDITNLRGNDQNVRYIEVIVND